VLIYHYHAIRQIQAGTIWNMDGIVTTSDPVETMEQYREVKALIAKDDFPSTELCICSLSLLGTK